MMEVLVTNDPVQLSWARTLLEEAGIACLVFDENASAVEGSIGAIPRRLMVADEDRDQAVLVLQDARRDLAQP
jgi:hypothetical protein